MIVVILIKMVGQRWLSIVFLIEFISVATTSDVHSIYSLAKVKVIANRANWYIDLVDRCTIWYFWRFYFKARDNFQFFMFIRGQHFQFLALHFWLVNSGFLLCAKPYLLKSNDATLLFLFWEKIIIIYIMKKVSCGRENILNTICASHIPTTSVVYVFVTESAAGELAP